MYSSVPNASSLLTQEEMDNKAMYLSTNEERETPSLYEEAYDGRNLLKLNLCDEGKKNFSFKLKYRISHSISCWSKKFIRVVYND